MIPTQFTWIFLGFQQELHDPVEAVRRIQDFSWIMMKLSALMNKTLNEPDNKLTHYKQLLAELKNNSNDEAIHQGISLTRFNVVNSDVPNRYAATITKISSSMGKWFRDLQGLSALTWPRELDGDISSFGNTAVSNLLEVFRNLLQCG